MSLNNLSFAWVEIPVINFIAVLLKTQITEALFVRDYCSYPEVALEAFARDVAQELAPDTEPELKGHQQVELPNTGIELRYVGRGKLKIDLRLRQVKLIDFATPKAKATDALIAEVLSVLRQDKTFENFEISWQKN